MKKWEKEKVWAWYNINLHPYNPKEIAIIKKFSELANKKFTEGNL